MTQRIGNIVIIEDEPDKVCTRCKQLADTRDVLGDGSQLCFKCATEAEKKVYTHRLFAYGDKGDN